MLERYNRRGYYPAQSAINTEKLARARQLLGKRVIVHGAVGTVIHADERTGEALVRFGGRRRDLAYNPMELSLVVAS